ncbi:hypothetical protein [Corynebacterium sp. 335C]
MNYQETEYWIANLFPGEMSVEEVAVVVPARGRHGRDVEGAPFTLGGFALPGTDPEEDLWCTLDLGRFDAGLRTPEGADVRVEVFSAGFAEEPVSDCVAAAATMLAQAAPGELPPTPGTLLPDLVELAVADVPEELAALTVSHGLLVVPYLWPQGTPMVTETPDTVSRHDGEPEGTPDTRVTTVIQLITVTDAEAAFAAEHGVAELTALLEERGADLRDLRRASVV